MSPDGSLSTTRRYLLVAVATAVAGCGGRGRESTASPTGAPTSTEAPTSTPRPTPPPDDPIEISVRNETDSPVDVRLVVSGPDGSIADRTVAVPSEEHRTMGSGIRHVGEYDLAVTVDGDRTVTEPVSISNYDVREGSNGIVAIEDLRIEVYWEE